MIRRIILIMMTAYAATTAKASDVPSLSCVLPGYDRLSVEQRLDSRQLLPLEGLWVMPEEKMTVAIETDGEENGLPTYRIVAVEAANAAIDCGLVIGYAQPSADPGKLRLWLYSEWENETPSSPRQCVGTLTGDRSITIARTKIGMRLSVNVMRFMPSVFGAFRLYPHVDKPTVNPGLFKTYPPEDTTPTLIF